MDFRSDNVASVAPQIMTALIKASRQSATPYGDDPITKGLESTFSKLFETDVHVFPVVTGTIANALGVSAFTPPYGVIYSAEAAHVQNDECGAPEFMTGGAKVIGVAERHGKIDPTAFQVILSSAGAGEVHWAQPACLSLTQPTEMGQIYTPEELKALIDIARSHNLAIHMDGARFANAVAAGEFSPADLTWRAGVDVMSFGATKNGAMAAEAIILFNTSRSKDLAFRHKRAGQLLSKMHFISSQLSAYISDDLWLRLATHANEAAQRLVDGLQSIPGAELAAPLQTNEIFVSLPTNVIVGLSSKGAQFYRWPETDPTSTTIRLVTRHDTCDQDIENLISTARALID